MLLVTEHRIALLGDTDAAEIARQVGEVRDLDAGDIVEIPGIIGIGANAVSYLSDPSGKAVDILMEARPESGNAGAAFVAEAIADAGDQNRLGGLKTRRRDGMLCGGVHEDRLL